MIMLNDYLYSGDTVLKILLQYSADLKKEAVQIPDVVPFLDMFGVRDPSILSAIRKHTVGAGDMSPMDALIYVADFIEPGREPFPGLEKARRLAEKDIYQAMLCCAELTAKHLRAHGQDIHPRTLNLISAFSPE